MNRFSGGGRSLRGRDCAGTKSDGSRSNALSYAETPVKRRVAYMEPSMPRLSWGYKSLTLLTIQIHSAALASEGDSRIPHVKLSDNGRLRQFEEKYEENDRIAKLAI